MSYTPNKAVLLVKSAIGGVKTFYNDIFPRFLQNTFEVKSTKHSKITAVVITAVLFAVVLANNNAFLSLGFKEKWWLLAFAFIMPFIIGAIICYSITVKNKVLNCILHFSTLFLLPFVTITMTECLNNIFIYDMTYLGFLGNYLLVLLLNFFVFAVSGSFRATVIAVNTPLFGLAVAHCYIMEFRGTPFIPMDFLGITTAANVANTYTFKLNHLVLIGLLLYIFLIVFGIKLKTPDFRILTKIISRTVTGAVFAVTMSIFFLTSFFADMGIKPDFWNQTRGYRNYGFAFNFFCNTKYLYMSTPNGYDPNDVGEFVDKTVSETESEPVATPENAPDIICIMNESLSDLSVLGEISTNADCMPFIHSLTENTVKGNLYVPVVGAGTSNTEFEFLTGHSTAFLPSGSNAYMLYIKNPIASLVSTLEGQGYSSFAFHPYYSSGWNRVNVYKYMSFNRTSFLENIMDISIMNEYLQNPSDPDYMQTLIDTNYPDRQNMILRQYISDSYDYRVLIEDYENRDKSIPYFAFNVTMQNHGGYTTAFSNFNQEISLTDTSLPYIKTNRYLSLVKKSDEAFEELINYFKNVKKHTVICMFGDHQPTIETSFVAKTLGTEDLSDLTIEQEQKRHITPFIIWANYDIEEKEIEKLSCNYLSSYVLEVAGVHLTEYNKYLLRLSEKLPVIDTVGYIDSEGNYFKWSDRSQYNELLSEYEKIQYNNIFDSKNKNTSIFYLKGYTGDEGVDLDGDDK